MPVREIPPGEWADFCAAFSRRHEGWLADLEVDEGVGGWRPVAARLPLSGVTLDADRSTGTTLWVTLGGAPGAHVTHAVRAPARVRLEETAEGAESALEIEARGGERTRLRFRAALPVEMVDGVLG